MPEKDAPESFQAPLYFFLIWEHRCLEIREKKCGSPHSHASKPFPRPFRVLRFPSFTWLKHTFPPSL